MTNQEMAVSPLDDRYRKDVKELVSFFSEMGLMKYRIQVEVEYLIALTDERGISQLPPLSRNHQKALRRLYLDFSSRDFDAIKKIEEETRHDVKAVEYYLRQELKENDLGQYEQWIHFALTSEDVNNLAYNLIWRQAVAEVYLPVLERLIDDLRQLAKRHRKIPMLAFTHGQPATPTSLGKEFAVFVHRLARQLDHLNKHHLQGKLSGASGTWSGHVISFPEIDWLAFSRRFVSSLGLRPNLVTTQIESNDTLAESYHILIRVNTILIDLCRDMWHYTSRGLFRQEVKAGEVGSSTMPHKVNPIHFENAEGNLGLANAHFSHLAGTLPVSRLQRDLSGSTVIRNQGVPLAHSLLACKNIRRGLGRMTVDEARVKAELNEHWEVLTEAVQTVLRKGGDPKAYEKLKQFARGKTSDRDEFLSMVKELELPDSEKEMLLSLTPETYVGLASKIVGEI